MNVLVYAHRADEGVHPAYRDWLARRVSGAEPFALSVLVAAGFVRIVTNRKIFPDPTPLGIALGVVDALVARASCQIVAPGADHWRHVATLCRAANATGKLVADAQHAAIAIEHGCTLVSRDQDFTRFVAEGLRFQHLVLG